MEELKRMQEDVEMAIQRYEEHSEENNERKEPEITHVPENFRERLREIIHSHKFLVAIIILVALDCLTVIAVMLFDLQIIDVHEDLHYIPEIFHYTGIAILSIFMIEIALRLYVYRLSFFKHKLEMFDATVVIISFALDIVFIHDSDATVGTGLIILLRLWRIGRIVNGIVLSVKKQAAEKLEKECSLRDRCEENLSKYQSYCKAMESEITKLQMLVKSHDPSYTYEPLSPPMKDEKEE